MYYESEFGEKTPPSVEFVRSQYQLLSSIFSERNAEYQILRDIFDGMYASVAQAKAKVGTPFQNTTKLIYNMSNASVRRYMDQMSAPPSLEGVPEGFELQDIELADKRTKFLEYIWSCNNMPVKLMHMAFYQSLLDHCILHVRPAPHLAHKIRIEVGVPDFYYPITRGDDWEHPVAVIYAFRTFKDQEGMKNAMRFDGQSSVQFETNIEYHDANWFVSIKPDKIMMTYHGLGELLWVKADNLPIPHRFRGQGDVDQAVGMNEYVNMLMSAMGDMIAYAAAPIAVVRGTKVGGTNLPFEPRAVWELERDAQVGFLQWSGTPPAVEAQILRSIQAIEDLTGVSSPAFGREIPSGVSGNAVRSLLAGFNTRLGTKQTLLGNALVTVNERIQLVAEKMFPNEQFRISGENITPGKDLGRRKMYTVQPKEFKGWYRNKVTFPPQDPSGTFFQEMEKFSKGLQSKYSTQKNIGIKNVWDEQQRIEEEHREQARRQNDLAMAQQGQYVHPEQAAAQQQEDSAALEELMKSLQGGAVPGRAPDGVADRQADRQQKALALTQQPGQTGEVVTGEPAPAKEEGDFPAEAIMAKLKSAQMLMGKAALQGRKLLIEDPSDEVTLRQVLGADAAMVSFSKLDPDKPLPDDAIQFGTRRGQKKNLGTEIRKIQDGYLSAVILEEQQTNNAYTYVIGIKDQDGEVRPFGKTDPSRGVRPERGQLVRVSVGAISRRPDGDSIRWGLGQTRITQGPSQPVKVSTVKEVERMFEGGKRES